MKRIIPIILASAALAGCITIPPKEVVVIDPRPPIVGPVVEPTNPQPVRWVVLNSQGVKDLAARINATGEEVVLYVLDTEGFKSLATNLEDIRRYIREQNEAYRFVLEAANEPVEEKK